MCCDILGNHNAGPSARRCELSCRNSSPTPNRWGGWGRAAHRNDHTINPHISVYIYIYIYIYIPAYIPVSNRHLTIGIYSI